MNTAPEHETASGNEPFATFLAPPAQCRPRMRWWWFGPDVERGELERELTAMRDAGIGGVEVAFEYPLSAVEHPFVSPGLLSCLRFAAQIARSLGLGFDLTLGSGWSFGGPHIGPETAARALRWDVRDIGAAELEARADDGYPHDELIAVYVGDGSLQEPPSAFAEVPVHGGRILVPGGRGPRVLAIARSRLTGQQVKRAAAGAEGPVLDHYSAAATLAHLRAVADPMLEAVPAELIDSVFCDSLEAYGANWTPDLAAEFARRRGHELVPDLWKLRFDAPGSAAFRREYYATLGELYEDNFLDVIRAWAAERGVPFRVQSYGTPPARLMSYGHADLTEGEGWGWRGVTQTRWASSAAHHLGRAVVSSETWTWVHSPSFRATPLDLKGEAHEHFLLGINQFVGHGWPYSAPDAGGLGWFFYASGALDDRNAWWPAMPSLMTYLTRLSWLLRQGEPVRDVLLYLPTDDVYPHLGPEQGGSLDLWRGLRDHIGDEIPAAIRDAGFDFDLVDDDSLQDALGHDCLVVLPFTSSLPERTRSVLAAARDRGVPVIAVGGRVRSSADAIESGDRADAGFDSVQPHQLTETLRHHRRPDLDIEPAAEHIGFVHRSLPTGDVYVLVNTGPTDAAFTAVPRSMQSGWQLWSAENNTAGGMGGGTGDGAASELVEGSAGDAAGGSVLDSGSADMPPQVRLAPYEAVVLVTDGIRVRDSITAAHPVLAGEHELGSGWRVRFGTGVRGSHGPAAEASGESGVAPGTHAKPDAGEEQAVVFPHDWQEHRPGFAGSALYECEFDAGLLWPHRLPVRVLLDLGDALPEGERELDTAGIRGASYRVRMSPPVADVAEVEVNGHPCGLVFSPPYTLDITAAMRPGRNTLRIRVSNSTAAALADENVRSEVDALVTLSRERYGTRFRMQDLDAAAQGLRSGLLATPRLRWSDG